MERIFSDLTNEFQLVDFSATHNQLLLRSMKNRQRGYNIDIIIKGVRCVLIPTSFKGLEIIYSESDDSKHNLVEEFGFIASKNFSIFCFRNSGEKKFYINAMALGVYHNKLDILESSIGRYDMSDLGENILWFNG